MASKSSSASTEDKSISPIKRTAFDTSGDIGSLYDGYRDQILGKLALKTKKKPQTFNKPHCEIIEGRTDDNRNLLQLIPIEEELRLSLLLNLLPCTELVSLIDYSHPINEYTRILYYTHIYREDKLLDDTKKIKLQNKSPLFPTNATHIISGVTWGLRIIIVLQLPFDTELTETINATLHKIKTALCHNQDFKTLDLEDQNIVRMKVYSNIPFLTKATSLNDICQKIHFCKVNRVDHRPIEYTLRSIQDIDTKNTDKCNMVTFFDASYDNNIEQYFLQMSTAIKVFDSYLNKNGLNVLDQNFMRQLYDMNKRLIDIKKKYSDALDRFSKLVVDFRHGAVQLTDIEEAFNDEQSTTLKRNIEELTVITKDLSAKEKWIIELQQQSFKYWNVAEHGFEELSNQQIIEQTLIRDHRLDRVLCSSDTLNESELLQFNQLRDRLIEEHHNNPELRLFYADFSACSFRLPHIIILPKDDANNHTEIQESMETETLVAPSADNVVNILLLGESGVGKSTFINAFVNYLKYQTMKEAESNKPFVLIPVSFLTTVGNNFDEHRVKFGDCDETNNEDFDHPGQSVTQRCKSYVFDFHRNNNKKLRIIDTPGFGDTRGLDQDDLNMQYILEYISNLTHLDAVCFLLKPNVTRLNSYFRICVSQLLDLLGPDARQNIIFGFTNSRCTFYTPGDTAPALRALLRSLQANDIPCTSTNTFSFDSESFRYLVALQNSVTFSGLDRNEYEKSWSTSATESNRLIDYICSKKTASNTHYVYKSVKHAQMEIVRMIRPLLETMRNTLRNVILLKMKLKDASIQLISKGVELPNTVCLSCKPNLNQIANFSIVLNESHGGINKCLMCQCTSNQHIPIDYTLSYKVMNNPANVDEKEMIDQISLLLNASVELARVLKTTNYFSKDDLFLLGLKRMIGEEKWICAQRTESYQLNLQLLEKLEELMSTYEHRMNGMKSDYHSVHLPVIQERIKITRNYPSVSEQMNAVEKGQENIMKYYEHQVSNDHLNISNGITTDI